MISTPTISSAQYRKLITANIESLLNKNKQEFKKVNPWGTDVIDKLLKFIISGKIIRGSLVLFTNQVFTGKISKDAVKVAAAIELFHSSLLIQDDIMDNDTVRRGMPAIFSQYQSFGEKIKLIGPRHFGESMSICVSDIGFFLAFQLMSSIKENKFKQTMIEIWMNEMMFVGLAQMQDVYAGYAKDFISKEEIENVYLYKTGRYSFSLPLMLGVILSYQNKQTLQKFEKLGECIGVLFQLKDDALSLFGDQLVTGKEEGSDIRENKKTLHRFYLFEKATAAQRIKLEKIFGNKKLTHKQLIYVRMLIKDLNVQKIIDKRIQNLQNNAKEIIMSIKIQKLHKDKLVELVSYIIDRNI
jgi:geranylgeranyl diphosphate synthase type I